MVGASEEKEEVIFEKEADETMEETRVLSASTHGEYPKHSPLSSPACIGCSTVHLMQPENSVT